ncbi:MAG: DUF4834 family protein [Clostridiales bacterium]|nr:DUF4834 family protein [Clostridiales bacterium]
MGFVIFLLIILFFWFLPRILRWLMIYMVKKKTASMYEQMFGQAYNSQQQQQQRRRRGGWSAPEKKRKKIDSNVGEYVQFQEVKVTETTNSSTEENTQGYTVEQQVSDAEWEEIK